MKFILLVTLNLLMLSAFGQAPTVPASNLNFANILCNQFDVNWTNGNGTSRLVFVKEKSPLTSVPTNNEFYSSDSKFWPGGERLDADSGAHCVYRGTGSSLTVTGLKSNTRYYVAVFEYNSPSAGIYTYLTSSFPKKDTVTRTIVSDFTMTPLAQCFNGNSFSFKNTSSSDFPLTYLWNFGDGDTSSKADILHQYKSYGIYNVKLQASATGCNSSTIKTDTIYPSPTVQFELNDLIKNNDSVQCYYKNKFTFQNKTSLPSIGVPTSSLRYFWFDDGTLFSSAYRADIHFTSPGLKTVKLVAISDKNCKDSITHFYKVIGNIDASKVIISPKLMPLASNKFSFVNNNIAYAIQKWYIKGKYNPSFSDSMNGQSFNYTFKDSGTYYIILRSRDTAGCVDMQVDSIRVYSGSAGLEKNLRFKITIYPNPSEGGIFNIRNLPSGASIKLYDMIGKEILNSSPQKSETEIDLSGFERGMYYLSVTDDFNTYCWKLFY